MYTIKAIYRRTIWMTLRPFVKYHPYSDGVTGWDGSYSFLGKCLCFRADDGSMVFQW